MRYPDFLPENGTIGYLAPSFGCNTEPYKSCFHAAMREMGNRGYHNLVGPNCELAEGIGISNSPQKCGAEVMEMFGSEADVLISCGGGEMMCEILPYVDFNRLSEMSPKWFMGYSDNTNLDFLLTTVCDTASIYGPCISSFGMQPWHPSIQDALELLQGKKSVVNAYGLWESESLKNAENPYVPYNVTEPLAIKTFIGKEQVVNQTICFEGRLIGGCLDCLSTLVGTTFDNVKAFDKKYAEDGFVWFLEACDLNVFGIRRALWQLKNAGWFEHVKGFLIGRPYMGDEIMNLDRFRAVVDILQEWNVPVIMDLDIGHKPPMMPLIVGSYAKVCCENNKISIEMDLK